ncbi:MAG: hypothetical protein HOP28_06785 [Gemmatimonadales bacterium]|nr:hypothetical protein [Gemmatimonadales bacterium]
MNTPPDLAALFLAQADDLARLQALTDAQAAVLMTHDIALLERFGREADELVDALVRRHDFISRQPTADPAQTRAMSEKITRAVDATQRALAHLSLRLLAAIRANAKALAEAEREWERVAAGYQPERPPLPAPLLVDRTG